MEQQSEAYKLSLIYQELKQYPLTAFIESAQKSESFCEREFYMTLLNYGLKVRQRRFLLKKGGTLLDG